MKGIFKMRIFFVLIVLMFFSSHAFARAVDEIKVKKTADGYEMAIDFNYPFEYMETDPGNTAKIFYVQLRTENFQSLAQHDIDSIQDDSILSWDESTGLPMSNISFDGSDAQRPKLMITFSQAVNVNVHSEGDMTQLIIDVKT
jgi:hypothetical protein